MDLPFGSDPVSVTPSRTSCVGVGLRPGKTVVVETHRRSERHQPMSPSRPAVSSDQDVLWSKSWELSLLLVTETFTRVHYRPPSTSHPTSRRVGVRVGLTVRVREGSKNTRVHDSPPTHVQTRNGWVFEWTDTGKPRKGVTQELQGRSRVEEDFDRGGQKESLFRFLCDSRPGAPPPWDMG